LLFRSRVSGRRPDHDHLALSSLAFHNDEGRFEADQRIGQCIALKMRLVPSLA
jgi:hypothetical protein